MIMLGNEQVLSKFRLDEAPAIKDFLEEFGYELTRCYYPSAQINSIMNADLWKDPEIGLKTVLTADGLMLGIVYPARDRNTNEVGTASRLIAKVDEQTGDVRLLDSIRKSTILPESDMREEILDGWELILKLRAGLGPNPEVIENDLEDEIQGLLESGDLDGLEDLVGDRDLAEFI